MVTDAEGKIGHTIALRDATHTNAARTISLVDGSLKDVQMLAGHTRAFSDRHESLGIPKRCESASSCMLAKEVSMYGQGAFR
jgi:hypothetical protein